MKPVPLATKRPLYLILLAVIFDLALVHAWGLRAASAQKTITFKQTWSGQNLSRDLQATAPSGSYIANETTWRRLWQAWRGAETLPDLDFANELIVFCTTVSPNSCGINLSLDEQGDLNITPVSTLIASDAKTFNYQIVLIDRAGIKSIGGKPITSGNTATSKGPDDEVVGMLKQATQEMLDAIAPGKKSRMAALSG